MAEIPVRRKEGRNVWPLLLGLLVLAAVLWFVVVRKSPSTAAVRADSAAAASSNVTRDSVGGTTVRVDTAGKADTAKRKP